MEYICNVHKSPVDLRDYKYVSGNLELPENLDYTNDLNPIRNQGSQGSCFAQTAACVKEWQEKKDYGFEGYLSPQFFYNCRPNKYDNKINNDDGMFGRDVMKLMKNIGICSEISYPYGKIEHKDSIPKQIYTEARKHIVKGYARINSIDSLKNNLFKNGPSLIVFPVYNFGSQFWIKKGELVGGHAVTVIGYNRDGFIIRNSWGTQWANDGYSIYKYTDWNAHWEIWTTIDDKSVILNNNEMENIPLDDENNENEEDGYDCCIIL